MPSVIDLAMRVGRAGGRRAVGVGLARIGSVVSVVTARPCVALTFDDGPDEENTPRVLEVLGAHGASATFFVLLTRVRRSPGLVGEIIRAGHEIALHGPDHRRLTAFTAAEVTRRLSEARDELSDLTGTRVRWFRPPYGAQGLGTALAIRQAGLTAVLWGPSLWDWKDADSLLRKERALRGLAPGAIVLAHDGIAGREDGDETGQPPHLDRAEWLSEVLGEYTHRGLGARSLGELAATGRLRRRARFVR